MEDGSRSQDGVFLSFIPMETAGQRKHNRQQTRSSLLDAPSPVQSFSGACHQNKMVVLAPAQMVTDHFAGRLHHFTIAFSMEVRTLSTLGTSGVAFEAHVEHPPKLAAGSTGQAAGHVP